MTRNCARKEELHNINLKQCIPRLLRILLSTKKYLITCVGGPIQATAGFQDSDVFQKEKKKGFEMHF